MRAGLMTAALAALLCGCGQSGGASTETTPAASTAVEPTKTPEQKAAALAALPAPYNTADLVNGEAKFALCKSCHTLAEGGPNLTGPNLHGVYGHPTGKHPDFKHSEALMAAGLTWDGPTLDKWIENPRALVPGTKMSFAGLKDPKDRTDVIAYLAVEGG